MERDETTGAEAGNGWSAPVKIVVQGLKLPTMNQVLRWYWRQRHAESKRVRSKVEYEAIYGAGLVGVEPLAGARVQITAYGPYHRRDSDNTYLKDCLDSIVARPLWKGEKERRWGLIKDDNRKTIGEAQFKTVLATDYRVEIEVTDTSPKESL